jgi:hypothetical protein
VVTQPRNRVIVLPFGSFALPKQAFLGPEVPRLRVNKPSLPKHALGSALFDDSQFLT